MKKIFALVLALAMVLFAISALASEPTEFTHGDFSNDAETRITATNIDEGDTVYYIQLLTWNGNSAGTADPNAADAWSLTEYGTTANVSIAELLNGITAAEAAQIATNLKNVTGTPMTTDGTTAYADVAPGLYYLRAVATSDDTIYNPAFVSADYYAGNNEVSYGGTIGSSSVVKKSSVVFDKQVGQGETHDYTFNDVKPGDIIPYKITTKIPAYGANYDEAQFEVTDTFSTGLVLKIDDDHPFTVTYGSASTAESVDKIVTITGATNNSSTFKVKFEEDYLLSSSRAVTDVVITYYGVVTTEAPMNVNVMDNTADLVFTNKPGETKEKHDITRHYTFSIDANLLGGGEDITRELMKTGTDQNGEPIKTLVKETVHQREVTALEGASFTLTPVSPTTGEAKTISSDASGRINFKGLDAGTYTLVENSAPTGYVKDSRTYTVVITPTYDTTVKDMLLSYKVEFKLGDTLLTTANFSLTNNDTRVTVSTLEDNTQFIGNTQGAELPSTGGIGTTIFYILGGLLVVGAVVILVARRKAQD